MSITATEQDRRRVLQAEIGARYPNAHSADGTQECDSCHEAISCDCGCHECSGQDDCDNCGNAPDDCTCCADCGVDTDQEDCTCNDED